MKKALRRFFAFLKLGICTGGDLLTSAHRNSLQAWRNEQLVGVALLAKAEFNEANFSAIGHKDLA